MMLYDFLILYLSLAKPPPWMSNVPPIRYMPATGGPMVKENPAGWSFWTELTNKSLTNECRFWRSAVFQCSEVSLSPKTIFSLGARTLLGAPGRTTRSKDATHRRTVSPGGFGMTVTSETLWAPLPRRKKEEEVRRSLRLQLRFSPEILYPPSHSHPEVVPTANWCFCHSFAKRFL